VKAYFSAIFAVLAKDAMLELRTKDILVSVVVFALLVIVIFNFALDPTPRTVALVAPGILWVAILFGGVLGLNRSFAIEQDRGNLYGLMLAPVGRDVIFFGKMLGNFLFMVVVEAIIYPVFAVLYNLPMLIPGLIPIALLATLGIATVGTAFAAMAINTRSREVMLPLLFFPVVVPVIVGAVEASGMMIRGDESAELARWIPFLIVFDAIFLVVCPAAFSVVIEE
jgi:heme exporter protein B